MEPYRTSLADADLVHMINEKISINEPIADSKKNLLFNPHITKIHPLWQKMTLITCQVSGSHTEIQDLKNHYLHFHGIMENPY